MNPPPRNYFSIVAHGPRFDVDGYLKRHPLRSDIVWHAGDLHRNGETSLETNGFEIYLGRDSEIDFEEQQAIAAAYLEANEVHLKELKTLNQGFYLGLRETVYPNSLGSIMDISSPLMHAVLKVGINLTIWACLEREAYRPRVD
ncbi:MAG TPA: hypothetical protein VGN12_08690 [Pirellulales bacterium]